LADGQYIDIKKRLNHGETEDMHARWAPFVVAGGAPQLNRREVRDAKVLAYLLGWSLTDEGKPVAFSPDLPDAQRSATLGNLSPERFNEIHDAIEAHEEAMAAERAALKKTNGGPPAADPMSPLPSTVGGPSTASVN
jgi:hypothetical protein